MIFGIGSRKMVFYSYIKCRLFGANPQSFEHARNQVPFSLLSISASADLLTDDLDKTNRYYSRGNSVRPIVVDLERPAITVHHRDLVRSIVKIKFHVRGLVPRVTHVVED